MSALSKSFGSITFLLRKRSDYIVIFLFSFFIYRLIFFADGTISRIDWDSIVPYNFVNWAESWLAQNSYVWNDYFIAGRVTVTNAYFPFTLLAKSFSFVINADLLKKFLFIFFSAMCGWSMSNLVKFLLNSYQNKTDYFKIVPLVSALFYMFNPWIINRLLFGGGYLFSYALLPLGFTFLLKILKSNSISIKTFTIFSLIFASIIFFERLMGYIGFIIYFGYFIFWLFFEVTKNRTNFSFLIWKIFLILLFLIVFPLLLNSYWLLPTLFSNSHFLPETVSSVNVGTNSVSSNFVNVFRLRGDPVGTFEILETNLISSPLFLSFTFLLPIFSFLSIIKTRTKTNFFFLVLSIFSIILSTGSREFFGTFYLWFYNFVPFFAAFRDPTKFISILTFCYSIMISFTLINFISAIQDLSKRSRNFILFKLKSTIIKKALLSIFLILISIAFFINSWPIFTNDFSDELKPIQIPQDYYDVHSYLSEDPNDFRILILPMVTPLSSDWIPEKIPYIHDPLWINPPNHAVVTGESTQSYMDTLLKRFYSTMFYGAKTDFNELLRLLKIKYIVFHKDNLINERINLPRIYSREWEFIAYDYAGFWLDLEKISTFLKENDCLNLVYQGSDLDVYEFQISTNQIIYSVNNVDIVPDYFSYISLKNNYNETIIPVTDLLTNNFIEDLNTSFFSKRSNGLLDLYFHHLFVDGYGTILFPFDYAEASYFPENGWVSSTYFPIYPDFYYYGNISFEGKFAYTRGQNVGLNLPFSLEKTDSYSIWIKMETKTKENGIQLGIDSKNITTITLYGGENFNFNWIEICSIDLEKGVHTLFFNSEKGENYIQKIFIVPSNIIAETKNLIETSVGEYSLKSNESYWLKPENDFTLSLDYSTKYNGQYSYKVLTNSTKIDTWSWIVGKDFLVNPNTTLIIQTSAKIENARQSHIVLEGYDYLTGIWNQISQIPIGIDGNTDWKTFVKRISVPINVSKMRLILNAGWVDNPLKNTSITYFDDIKVFESDESPVYFKYFESVDDTLGVSFHKLTPTKYYVDIQDASNPFFLIFEQTYNDNWIALIDEKTPILSENHFSANGFMNIWYINKTGNFSITLEFGPQKLFEQGLATSTAIFISLILLLLIPKRFYKNVLKIISKPYN